MNPPTVKYQEVTKLRNLRTPKIMPIVTFLINKIVFYPNTAGQFLGNW